MNNLTRRDFLKVLGVGSVAGTAALALAGCSDSSDSEDDTSSTTTSSSSSTETTTSTSVVEAPDTTVTSDADEAHDDSYAISDIIVYRTGNDVENFLPVHSEYSRDAFSGIGSENWIGVGPDNNVTYLLADSYEANSDSSVWTFHLRDGVKWVDKDLNEKADLVVTDFLIGAEFILNYHKNDGNNASMLTTNVEGAEDYYNYTKELSEEEAYALTYDGLFADMVGVSADESANTVTYTCTQPTPYFWSLGYHKCTSPLPAGLIDELGVENMKGISWEDLWYLGPYVITEFVDGNAGVAAKNTKYWNYDNVSLFDTVTSVLCESTDVAYQLYINGEIDYVSLSQSNLVSILNDSSNDYYDYVVKSYGTVGTQCMHLNFNSVDPDTGEEDTNWNKAVANENFRMAIYWGLDREGYLSYKDPVSPYSICGFTFTQSNFVNVDGVDYQDYVIDLLGLEKSEDYDSRYDPDLAASYMETAYEELSAEGVTFPINLRYYIQAGSQSALDQATLLKTAFDEAFPDYIDFELCTYISSLSKEVTSFGYHNINVSGWTADYSDPSNCIEQCSLSMSSNVYLTYSRADHLTEGDAYDLFVEFTDLCETARGVSDSLDERYKAYAEAEAFAVGHALLVPLYMNSSWQLTKINDYSKSFKGSNYVNWETNYNGYTTADYNTFAAEKAASSD